MKKIIKFALCLMMALGIAGCGSESTEKQEAVVTNFFEYLKAGDLDKMSTICTEDNSDVADLLSSMSALEEFQDVETYGQTFVDEANKFIDHLFASYVTSYEISSVEEDGDNYLVIADIKMKDYDNISFDLDFDSGTYFDDYLNEHPTEAADALMTGGEDAVIKLVMSDIAPQMFGAMTTQIDEAKDIDTQLRFTLVPDGENWLISTIEQREA